MSEKESKADKLRKLFPGRDVELPGTDIKVHIMPLRLGRLRECESAIADAADAIGKIVRAVMDKNPDRSDAQAMDDVIAALPGLIAGKLLDLVECDVPLADLPHHLIPPVISAWIEESFGGGKLAGWVETFKSVMALIQPSPAPQP